MWKLSGGTDGRGGCLSIMLYDKRENRLWRDGSTGY